MNVKTTMTEKYEWIKDAKNELKEQKKLVKQSEK